MNADDSLGFGFIAQEVAEVLPHLVSQVNDGTLTLSQGGMMPFVVKAIQEQQSSLVKLDSRISDGEIGTSTILFFDAPNERLHSLFALNMNNLDIENVKSIRSASGNWSLDEEGVLVVKEIKTEKLCIGQTCITENELKTILQTANISSFIPDVSEPDNIASVESTTTPPEEESLGDETGDAESSAEETPIGVDSEEQSTGETTESETEVPLSEPASTEEIPGADNEPSE
jgi:hypothetical protein